jgi:NAD(P)-dependent dehydrogenase (short-subunit alcohol dehydrogenase family)
MDFELRGKGCIVTGASRGIGRATAAYFAEQGARVLAVARTEADLNALAEEHPNRIVPLPLDLREPAAAAHVVQRALDTFGRLDALLNVAGATVRGDFLQLGDAAWEDGFALKFFGAMRLARAAWPALVDARGSLVFTAGIGGRTGSAEFAIGGAVNAAVLNLTKVLADRGVTDGVRVNAINPGSVRTARLETRIATFARDKGLSGEAAAEALAQKQGVARFGEPVEIARAMAFLASPAASYCQGVVLDVDGGATRTL